MTSLKRWAPRRGPGKPPHQLAPLRQILLAFVGVGLFAALASSLWPDRIYSFDPRRGSVPIVTQIPWGLTFAKSILPFLWWLPLAPLVVAMSRRADLLVGSASGAVLAHVTVGGLLSLLHAQLSFLLHAEFGSVKLLQHPGLFSEQVADRAPGSFFIYCVIAGITYAFDYSLRYRARASEAGAALLKASNLEAELARARLSMLQAQLNPHFLFNTLNSISALVNWRPEDARRLIGALGDLLRLTVDEGEEPVILLDQELAWLRKYVEIQQIRFGERLAVRIEAQSEALVAAVPCFILQPLVENAVKHGLEGSSDRVNVLVQGERDGDVLRLIVRDDGPGLPEVGVSEGVGLSNTRRRLELLYGDRQSMVLRNSADGGAEAVVTLPFAGCRGRGADLIVEEVRHGA